MILPCLYIGPAGKKGRGVFTKLEIEEGTIVEISPVIVMEAQDRKLVDQTLLHDYIFEWGNRKGQCCMALGYLALYNHSYQANCEYEMDYGLELITVRAMQRIASGEQLHINYNGDWNNNKPVWFTVE
jgi:SET domain-containing protein